MATATSLIGVQVPKFILGGMVTNILFAGSFSVWMSMFLKKSRLCSQKILSVKSVLKKECVEVKKNCFRVTAMDVQLCLMIVSVVFKELMWAEKFIVQTVTHI